MSNIKGHQPKPEECECCLHETSDLTEYVNRGSRDVPFGAPEDEQEWVWFCDVCAGTVAGNAHMYPDRYPNRHVLIMIAACTNKVLDAIEAARPWTSKLDLPQ